MLMNTLWFNNSCWGHDIGCCTIMSGVMFHVSVRKLGRLEGLRHQGGSSDPAAAARWPTHSSFEGS